MTKTVLRFIGCVMVAAALTLLPGAATFAAGIDPDGLLTWTGKVQIAHPTSAFSVVKDPTAKLGHRMGQQYPVSEHNKAIDNVEYIYDNAYGFAASISYTGSYPPHSGEDITLGAGSVPYPGMLINEFGTCWVIQPGGAGANLALVVEFYDNFDPNAALGPPPADVMSTYIGGYGWAFGPTAAGGWCAPQLSISPAIVPADANVFVVMYWLDLNDPTLNTYTENVSPGFQTASPPAYGSSPNRYYRDGGTRTSTIPPGPQSPARDGVLASNEAVALAAPRYTNFFMRIGASPNLVTVTPGIDLLMTPPGDTHVDFAAAGVPIPSGFFGPGSDPFTGRVDFVGKPLNTATLGATDTIVERTAAFDIDGSGSSASTPMRVDALSLTSAAPITVTYGGHSPQQWTVDVCLSSLSAQDIGTLHVFGGECAGEGGTFSGTLPVKPKFTFTRVTDGAKVVLDGGAFTLAVSGYWSDSLSGNVASYAQTAQAGLTIDADCNPQTPAVVLPGTSNFYPSVRKDRCIGHCDWGVGTEIVREFVGSATGIKHGVFWPLTTSCYWPSFSCDDIDGDQIMYLQDNCPFVANPDQADADGDSYGDACDTCPLVCDTNQLDTDTDGAGDSCDCLPLDPTVKYAPREIAGVLASGNLGLAWNDESGYAGTSTLYDVAKGGLRALKVSGFPAAAICAADNLGAPTYSELASDCSVGAGDGCFYLVRAQNICGVGTYGAGTPVPTTLDPGPCP